ncbi:oxidoreductase domain protein [Beutenbergia cavernae DSM 12333]|uniref:Oxidoreductase domain protein n=1 Tax=Beutenbergia cavernae (strain ATCC BAA-8 / DSM 12333 / CCUG 43141 / JCM 11478 / NBRC 16432 / NCIMB 13614 / HKI 0122) TaxID=471853 RepID=C5BX64_BEUC1|nr:Gfo/Idh/MocA family oxidoreductase [Beutenbergia cavernae]ACQ78739.1 oxidoreductase domain protein [Beutenbergia cavernae DSM 12333]
MTTHLETDRPLRWGILGPGRIAEKVAADFTHVRDGVLVAVGSRSQERATAFASRFADVAPGPIRPHGSYADLLADDGVDAVYIATPHSEHARNAVDTLRAGKATLVEKAFTATYAGAERVVATARETGVFAMEAMWTRFQPAIVRMRELIADGAIGEVRGVQADLGTRREFDPDDRTFNLALGGGTLLDLGVYVVSFAQMVLGDPVGVTARGSLLPSGADAEAGLLLDYGDGRVATLQTSFVTPSPGNARVYGTAGWIDVPPRFHHPHEIVLHRQGRDAVTERAMPDGAGYALELDEVARCVRAGRPESAVMPLADSLAVQRVLQDAADQMGVAFVDS